MNNPLGFFVDLLRQPLWVPAWVTFLVAVNLFSLRYWEEPLARLVLVTFLLSALLMMALYARFGFEKILGLGHVLWIGLLPYLLASIPGAAGEFQAYLAALAASIAVSLAFDIVDVWKYFAARRAAAAQ
ncbi:MAG: hypothetical protein ACNA8G_06025 [Gammaproteobacteria bacterium]